MPRHRRTDRRTPRLSALGILLCALALVWAVTLPADSPAQGRDEPAERASGQGSVQAGDAPPGRAPRPGQAEPARLPDTAGQPAPALLDLPYLPPGMSMRQIQDVLRQLPDGARISLPPRQSQDLPAPQAGEDRPGTAEAGGPGRHEDPPRTVGAGRPGPSAGPDAPQSMVPSPPPSPLETLFRSRYGTEAAASLSQYGYDLFGPGGARTAARAMAPGGDYLLGQGDVLRLRIWGAGLDQSYRVQVARDGTIDVPRVGVLNVAGLRLDALEAAVLDEALRYAQGIKVHASAERLRDVEVYVVGEVGAPGLAVVPAFSTVLTGLSAAGGVKKSGSLRSVVLRRTGGPDREIDLYELMLRGRRRNDVLLESRDTIFVPRIGPAVALTGAVAHPGIYELKGEARLAEALALAGGELPQGNVRRVHLRRFDAGREFVVKDLDGSSPVDVRNGDLIEVGFIEQAVGRAVKLAGHVWYPNTVDFRPGLTLAQVLTGPELLKPEAVTDFGLLYRYDPATTRYRVETFPLAKVFQSAYDTPLRPADTILVLSRAQFGMSEPVTLRGAVWKEGEFPFTPGLTLVDLLAMGGGIRFGADAKRIEVSRKVAGTAEPAGSTPVETEHFRLDLTQARSFQLQAFDHVFVPREKDSDKLKTVEIGGEVRYPGVYRIGAREKLSDLVARAGGFTEEAYYFGSRFTSEKAREIQQASIDRLIRELELRARQVVAEQAQKASSPEDAQSAKVAEGSVEGLVGRLKNVKAEGRVSIQLTTLEAFRNSPYDFVLDDGDKLFVPKKPSFVAVVGSVYSPSSFLYQPETRLDGYLDKSGGPTATADKKHMFVLKANGEVVSKVQAGTFFSAFDAMTLMPGDTVVVPEDLERIPYLKLVKDLADIVFKIATTAGIAYAIL